MAYKGFGIIDPDTDQPWGGQEHQNWEDAIDYIGEDTINKNKDITGHKHPRLYDSSGNIIVGTDYGNNVVLGNANSDVVVSKNLGVSGDLAVSGAIRGAVNSGIFDHGDSGNSVIIDWSYGFNHKVKLTGNCNFLVINQPPVGSRVSIEVVQSESTPYTITWPTNFYPSDQLAANPNPSGTVLFDIWYDGSKYLSKATYDQKPATILYQDDFECDLSGFDTVIEATTGSCSTTTDHAFSGVKSMKADLPGFNNGYGISESLVVKTYDGVVNNDAYSSFRFYVPSSFTFNGDVSIIGFDGGPWVAIYKDSERGNNLYLKGLQADGTPDEGSHVISTDVWHHLQFRCYPNRNTVWLDGVLDFDNPWADVGKISQVRLGVKTPITTSPPTSSGSIYFDDFVFANGFIPMLAAGLTVRYPNTACRIGLPIDVVIYGYNSLTDTVVTKVDGGVQSETGSITGHERLSVDMTSLAVGDHLLEVQLTDGSSTIKASFSGTIRKYVTGTPTTSIDENNIVRFNGSKIFPITPTGWDGTDLISAGVVNAFGWAYWKDKDGNSPSYTKEELGDLLNHFALPSGVPESTWNGHQGTPAADANAVATAIAYINYLKSNSYLTFWAWCDEPKYQGLTIQRMLELLRATHDNDPNHPVFSCAAGYSTQSARRANWWYPIMPNSMEMVADILAFDLYPFIRQKDAGNTVAHWVDLIDALRAFTYDLVPWYTFIEAGIDCSGDEWDGYGPTPAQVRMEAWLAVIHGIKGIGWWGPSYWTTIDSDHLTVMAQFVTDIANYKDVILSALPGRTVASNQTSVGSRVDVTIREDSTKIYVFAARLSDIGETGSAISTQLTVSGLTGSKTVTVYNESRTVTATDGVFTDSFALSEVHIYEIVK